MELGVAVSQALVQMPFSVQENLVNQNLASILAGFCGVAVPWLSVADLSFF